MSFSTLGLAPDLLRAVAAQGYTEPTPVQREAIPFVLAGRDLLAGAQTGTGKTAAFVLPMLQLLAADAAPQGGRPRIRALILVPTRELAIQVEESVRIYGVEQPSARPPSTAASAFPGQLRALRNGPEIVVATPGRLLDHSRQGTIDLGAVEILVLDEADRMLDMGFIRDIRSIIALLPARRQNLLFSATFSNEIRALAEGLLDRPASVQVTPRNTPTDLVRQVVHPVDRARKRELLSHLVRTRAIDQALVFTRTKHGADRLAKQLLEDGIATAAIHGNKSQPQRVRALNDFKAGRVTLLIATEVAARGLDIEQLPHVVNYELPMVPSDYLHRIGRTGRAGHRRATPSRWSASTRRRCCARSSGCSAQPDPVRGRARLRAGSVHPAGADPPPHRRRRPTAAITRPSPTAGPTHAGSIAATWAWSTGRATGCQRGDRQSFRPVDQPARRANPPLGLGLDADHGIGHAMVAGMPYRTVGELPPSRPTSTAGTRSTRS